MKDTIYIWQALNLLSNGKNVYKIGVTSSQFGDLRMAKVASAGGFEPELIIKLQVYKPTKLEKQLLKLGSPVKFEKFDGYTEFRSLTDLELKSAINLIKKQNEIWNMCQCVKADIS